MERKTVEVDIPPGYDADFYAVGYRWRVYEVEVGPEPLPVRRKRRAPVFHTPDRNGAWAVVDAAVKVALAADKIGKVITLRIDWTALDRPSSYRFFFRAGVAWLELAGLDAFAARTLVANRIALTRPDKEEAVDVSTDAPNNLP